MYSERASRGLAVSQCVTSSEGAGLACIWSVYRLCLTRAGEDGSQDEGMQESDICDSINTADIHEMVVTRVNETLTAYRKAQGEFDSPVIKQLVPALATAVAVAVSEARKGVMRTVASHGHETSARSTATENRLFAAVTSLTYVMRTTGCSSTAAGSLSASSASGRRKGRLPSKWSRRRWVSSRKRKRTSRRRTLRLSTGSARSGGGCDPSW